jgi:putative tricarboxylic transport membrane protein
MRFNDALSGLAIIIVAAFGLSIVAQFPSYPFDRFGPGLFPGLTLLIMLLCGALLVLRGVRRRHIQSAITLEAWARDPRSLATLGVLIGGVTFYILFSRTLGFPITGFLLTFSLLLWMRGRHRWLRSLLISGVAALVIFFVFAQILRVPLPLGILTHLVY